MSHDISFLGLSLWLPDRLTPEMLGKLVAKCLEQPEGI